MDRFDIRGLDEWQEVPYGDALRFEVPNSARTVRVRVNSSGPCEAYASQLDGPRVLVAAFNGLAELVFSVSAEAELAFDVDEDVRVFCAGTAGSHVVPATAEDIYTTLEPRARRNGELDRMMMLMRLNEKRRDRQLQAELRQLRLERRRSAEESAQDDVEAVSPPEGGDDAASVTVDTEADPAP